MRLNRVRSFYARNNSSNSRSGALRSQPGSNGTGGDRTYGPQTSSRSLKHALLGLVLFGMAVMLSTASVRGSGERRVGQQEYIQPVPSMAKSGFAPLKADTRSNVELPSKSLDVPADELAPVVDLGPLDPGALSNLLDNQIGVNRSVNEDADAQAVTAQNPDGAVIRLFSIKSQDAKGLRVHFEGFDLPEGERVYVYGPGADSHVSGPYSGKGPFDDGEFWSDMLEGDTAIVEHLVGSAGTTSKIRVSEVTHVFGGLQSSSFQPQVLSCEVDAQCGNFTEKNAVARIVFNTPQGAFVCTGTLLNDRAQDQTPLFLTASHCVNTDAIARTVQAFWFYQTTACNSGVLRDGAQTSGTTMLVTESLNDSTLLKLLTPPPGGAVFSGWDPNERPLQTMVYGLHHPDGFTPPSVSSFLRSATGSITGAANCTAAGLFNGYVVTWTSGDTEPGSSGSGLFASDGMGLIGALSCGPATASCNNTLSLYSRFSAFYPMAASFLQGGGSTNCITGLSPVSRDFAAGGGSGSADVAAPGTCGWSASSNASWVTIMSGGQGTGNGTINYSVAANPGSTARSGQITVQGQVHTINQVGIQCSVSINPTGVSVHSGGGNFSDAVTAPTQCFWNAISDSAWITINSGGAGTGNGTVGYSVATFASTATRTGHINIGDQTLTVTQIPGPVITAVAKSGKHLVLTGVNFDTGSRVIMNGDPQKTIIDDVSPTTTITGKKLYKKINPGQQVNLQVMDSNGNLSPPFPYTKPASANAVAPPRARVDINKGDSFARLKRSTH